MKLPLTFLLSGLLFFGFSSAGDAQRGVPSFYLSATLIGNDGGTQTVGSGEIEFYNPNTGISAALNYRFFGRGRVSFETGMQLTSRNLKLTIRDPDDPTRPGRIGSGYPIAVSLPLRIILGKPASLRNDRNQGSGLYLGGMLRYTAPQPGDTRNLQRAVYRAVQPTVEPHVLIGARTNGGLLNFQFELMRSLTPGLREFEYAGQGLSVGLREWHFSVGVGHSFH